jgi:Ca-activated chloride channel family protein
MQALHDAILDALFSGGVLSDEAMQQLLGEPADGDQEGVRQQLEDLIQQIIDRMMERGFITNAPDLETERQRRAGAGGGVGEDTSRVQFEVTDKALDFLGYRALRDLLGSVGRSSSGLHDTRHLSTGVEAIAAPKPYEFGDTMNIDPSSTILNAVQRLHVDGAGPSAASSSASIDIDYSDLMVAQSDYQSSCATVIMLDCSHSMILYGEGPLHAGQARRARAVAPHSHAVPGRLAPRGAVPRLGRGDSAQAARARACGPLYTNTREGLRLARRILERQRKDMRQIVMITDGKPSALTRPDGQIYKNAFGLDPHIVSETFAEVNACSKAGIMINTFMLARDPDLVAFVRRVAAVCRGKAYFTTPYTLGQYVLMDYMNRKTKTIH